VPPWRGPEEPTCVCVDLSHSATTRLADICNEAPGTYCCVRATLLLPDRDSGASLRPPKINHHAAANSQPHERPMKQFLTTQDALMTRTVAATSLRPFGAELLS